LEAGTQCPNTIEDKDEEQELLIQDVAEARADNERCVEKSPFFHKYMQLQWYAF